MIPLQDRFRGCLLGLALADGLGAPYEGESASFIRSRFPTPEALFQRNLGTIFYTDDTQMTIGVAEALLEDGEIRESTLCKRFVLNYLPSRGYGRGARRILDAMEEGRDYAQVAEQVFPGESYGNGAAMRAAPIGLAFSQDASRLREQSSLHSQITHRHPLGIEGAQIIASAVAIALRSEAFVQTDFLAQLQGSCTLADYAEQWNRLPGLASDQISELGNGIEAQQSVMTAVACFLHWPNSFMDAVGHAILLGGDTDTIASMAGAISGAYLGLKGIPSMSLARLENVAKGRDYLQELADRLYERFSGAVV